MPILLKKTAKSRRFAMQNIFLRFISSPKAFWINAEKK